MQPVYISRSNFRYTAYRPIPKLLPFLRRPCGIYLYAVAMPDRVKTIMRPTHPSLGNVPLDRQPCHATSCMLRALPR